MRFRLLVFISTIVAICADGQNFDGVRASIRKQLVETQMPSIAVAVARNGKILWEEGFGWANREKRIPATAHTMYSLASISKPITTTGLMVLAGAGKVQLDRPINEYLGNAKLRARTGDAAEATVRRVANHSAGLPLHYQFFYEDEPRRPPSMDDTILRFGNLVTAPGEKYRYSNLGFGILNYVIARASGKPYADFMRSDVFLKLGLTRMSVGIGPGLENAHALRYGAGGLPIPFYGFDHPGASAVYASAHDLVRFGLFHLKAHLPDQQAILTDTAIDEMHKPTMKSGLQAGYGVGWATNDVPGGYRVVSHTGGMGGVATALRLVESEKLAVVVLCNGSSPLPHRIADEIFALMLPKWHAPTPQPAETQRPPASLTGNWTGNVSTYRRDLPITLEVLESGEVRSQLGNQLKMLWNDVKWTDGYLSGRILGDLGIEETAVTRSAFLDFTLKLRGDALNGSVSAHTQPAGRPGSALTQWVDLKKQ
ncbi:MAG: serine hydrolase domain-containing protein [Bryobacteraceae bacterium]